MMRGMGNMQGMMKQVQKMQKEMVKEQEALNSKEFIGESTNGYVKATFTGDKNYAIFRSIKQSSIRKMLTCYKIC
ncbi:hypothetical protein co-occurringwithRecR [Enterococcus sp. HSIEG1]|nr:hypothetical protein co-occurringwithRecR [Enterococcus sp. HSIEG1]